MIGRGKRENWRHVLFRLGLSAGMAAGIFTGMCALTACGKEAEEVQDGPVTLVYGTLHLEQEMDAWIGEYNLAQEEIQIQVREYGQDGAEEGLARLNAELVQGEGPDVIDLSGIDTGPWLSLGILADLYPFLEADPELQPENFMPGELRLYESGGHLYGIAPGYRLETLMGESAVLGEPQDWTVEKMCGIMEMLPEGSSFVNNLGSLGFLRIVLHRGMEEYVDWDAGTCSFDGESFKELLRLAAVMDTFPLFEDEEQAIAEGKLLAARLYLSGPEEYAEAVSLFQGRPTVCVGFPSREGGGALVTPYLPVGIRRGEKQEAAWEFVRSLLGKEFQEKHIHFNFPLRRDSLRKMLEEAAARSADNGAEEGAFGQEDSDGLYEVIYNTNCSQVYDADIWRIVEEEAGSCFAGDKSIEEAAGVIQSRAEIYVQENYAQGNHAQGNHTREKHSEESSGGEKTETALPEEILQQSREEFYDRAKRYESLSEQETDALYRRLLESRVMEREQMRLTGMAAGDYDGNGHTDMVVCLYSLAEDADTYGDGCLYLFMNEEEPCRIYEENCCYGCGFITDDFGADLDGDGKTEVVIQIQGTGNGGWGDFCGFVVKYENPGIRKMELPDDMADDCGIQVTVAGDPKEGVYTAYCGALDETIAFSADRPVDDMRGGNSRGYLLEQGEYRGEEVLLGYEYLYAGSIIEYVGAAVFVLGWDAEGSPYIRDWYIQGDTAAARTAL